MFHSPRLTEGGYDAGNDSDTVRGACNRPVYTHLYIADMEAFDDADLEVYLEFLQNERNKENEKQKENAS